MIRDEDLTVEDWALIEKYDAQEYDREQERRHRFEEYEPNECQDDEVGDE